jgi:hypothetical protein
MISACWLPFTSLTALCLVNDPVDRAMPFNYNERTKQILAPGHNILQEDLHRLKGFSSDKLLKIKERKSNVMKFNFTRTQDFPPELSNHSWF